MNKLTLVFFLSLFLTSTVIAQTHEYESQLEQVHRFLSAKYKSNTPGCVIGIVKDGKLIYNKGFGMANLDHRIPMMSQTTINIMSVSKQFTAACIALLAMDKLITLDDDIHKYIPQLPDYGHKITIEHLIRHTSGIRDYADLVTLSGSSSENMANRADALALLLRQKELNFIPGDNYSYSNSGYLLLTYIVETVSGMTFPEFAKKRIFDPLEMNNSSFSDDPHQIINNRATSYGKDESGNYFGYSLNDNRMGCAGLFTTVEDLYKWDQNFYHGKVGGEEFNKLMLSQRPLNSGKENDYAFGNIIDRHEGVKEVAHSGGLLGIRCKLSRFPTEKLSIIYIGNGSQNQNDDVYPIASLFLINKTLSAINTGNTSQSSLTNKIALSPSEIEKFTGLFHFRERDLLARVFLNAKGILNWEVINRNSKSPVYIESKTELKLPNGQAIQYYTDKADSISLVLKNGNVIGGKRMKIVLENQLEKYTGKYFSEELQAGVILEKDGSNIIFTIGGLKDNIFLPEGSDRIQFNHPLLGFVTLSFIVNGRNQVTGFVISTDRTNKLKFTKGDVWVNNKKAL